MGAPQGGDGCGTRSTRCTTAGLGRAQMKLLGSSLCKPCVWSVVDAYLYVCAQAARLSMLGAAPACARI